MRSTYGAAVIEVGSRRRAQPPPPHVVCEALIRFEVAGDRSGTDLRWTLLVDEPSPDPSLLGHMRQRINKLINANLRYTFGQ